MDIMSNSKKILHEIRNFSFKNRGTGAGGSKTNVNGLSFEKITSCRCYNFLCNNNDHDIISFSENPKKKFISIPKQKFQKYMKNHFQFKVDMHGCKQPDECFIDKEKKIIFIIEKKFQTRTGSVCEKIQTGALKRDYFSENIPDYKVEYIYYLSDYFKVNCVTEIKMLEKNKIVVLFRDFHKNEISSYILNYK